MSDIGGDALAAQLIADAGGAPKTKTGIVRTIVPIAILTAVAIAGGAAVGFLVGGQSMDRAEAALKPAEHVPAAATAERKADSENPTALVKLEPVITNIANPARAVVRLQASIVFRSKDVPDANILASEIAGDTLAFLRTIDLVQIEGARGLLHLKEDLAERARLRSPAVTDYLVESLVAQ